ncbi:hypothetical protein Bca52824_073020 [Brassica carinata]|uniref:Uncharacterized protein n=1 Tax=Brassica carinata TaxID=52824 RepID=A0A8X7U7I1_BRACI|nr:hypothetical protein Bca52824_073020 [Brassica carinata]
MRPSVVEGQSWENIEETRSTPSSVKALLRECEGTGVTFLIPTRSQRLWSPPLGFQCSIFNGCPHFGIDGDCGGDWRSMSVRTLEELTYTKSMGHGLFSIQMRPNYNVIVDHPCRTAHWQRFYFYVKSDVDHPDTASYPEDFVSDARAVVSRVQVSWKDITIERIRRVLDRISRRDWRSDLLPLITGNKRRFSIFSSAEQKIINAAREMKELPDLSALIKKKLSEAKKASSATPSEITPSGTTLRKETPREETPRETPRVKTPHGAIPPAPLPLVISPGPSTGPGNVDSSREDLTLISERETAEPSVTGGNKKRSAPDSSASAASQARTESDGPPKKKKKKEWKKKKSVENSSSRDAAARGVVDSDNSPSISLKKKKTARSHESSTPAASASAAKTSPAAPRTLVEGSSASEDRRVKFHDHVEFKYVGETPLSFAPTDCAELVRQIKGGRKDFPAVKDLIFKDAYVDAARTKILSDGSMNYVVELYDSALKEAMSKLKHADKLARAKDVAIDRKTKEFKATIDKVAEDRAQLIERKKAQKAHFLEKFGELKDKFEAAGDRANEGSVEPTGRELGELPLQEGGIVGEVVRLEDTTVASASDPTMLSTSLVVNEDPLVPVLGINVETETEPVNLLELSDSSTEEEGDTQLENTESGLVGSPQNEEGAVDKTDNLSVLPADATGEASDRLTAQVVEGGSDRVED